MVQELKDAQLRIKSNRCNSYDSDSMSPPNSAGINMSKNGVQLDMNGFVVPKKLHNPCMESRECQDLHREIKWNARA